MAASSFTEADFRIIEETPWGVPVLDVQPFTQVMISSSRDETCAKNAVSYRGDDGAELAAQPWPTRVIDYELRLPIDGPLSSGVVSAPRCMEEKWAIYLEAGELLIVRSWTRSVQLRAKVHADGSEAVIHDVRGFVRSEDEDPAFTCRALTYLIRDIGLGEGLPSPLEQDFDGQRVRAAELAFSLYGKRAKFVTHHDAKLQPPSRPLCAHTPLHIAAARSDEAAIRKHIAACVPIEARGTDGLTAMHWAAGNTPILKLLIELGGDIECKSRSGATLLMQAVQASSVESVRFLLARAALRDEGDERGFTALHRAAEMGQAELVRCLLDAGANPNVEAMGHTPASLAAHGKHADIVALLER